ncbi:hypothetical protein G7Z17_g4774 [Cylindrodendrum hubeiense]|uniref:Saccharopine dehydrogenase n=1 Tax=Cylindrodendrum hubeiense TaxID=595255 RepID=A0A9P5LIJ2_9HYPO|nr:hypothetical protein G7Z17_g4774 [Cylindrodendrum hubeiense]
MAEKKILVLGSGTVAKPCVDYLLRNDSNTLTVACRTLSTAEKVVAGRPRATAIALDVKSEDLDSHIAGHDLVISLVPFVYHADVIRSAIKAKTHVVTTSYVSDAMRELGAAATEAGIIVLNEVGVDPGVDHLYAMRVIGEVHDKGGKHNSATFLQNGKVVNISNKDLMGMAQPYHVMDGYSFVAYPNRDSTPFREAYGIPEAHTVIRGSLRYEGNPALVKALIDIGWIDADNKPWLKDGMSWAQIQQLATGAISPAETDLIAKIDQLCSFPSSDERGKILSGLRWMGLFSDQVPTLHGSLLDTLSAQLDKLCSFQPGERDLVMLQHKFEVEWKDGSQNTITSTLELFGDPDGYSGMSKAVGVTCGIATQLVLDGFPPFNKTGVLAPYNREMCDAIRVNVEAEGIKLVEKMY